MSGITVLITLWDGRSGTESFSASDLPHARLQIDLRSHRGRGAALKAGISEALAMGAERVLTTDAGAPLPQATARALVDRLEHHAAVSRGEHGDDVVVGRVAGAPPVDERLFAALANRRLRARLSMYHGVTVAYRADVLRVVHLERLPDDDGFERALLLSLLARGFRVSELEIPPSGEASTTPGGLSSGRAVLEAARWLAWPRA